MNIQQPVDKFVQDIANDYLDRLALKNQSVVSKQKDNECDKDKDKETHTELNHQKDQKVTILSKIYKEPNQNKECQVSDSLGQMLRFSNDSLGQEDNLRQSDLSPNLKINHKHSNSSQLPVSINQPDPQPEPTLGLKLMTSPKQNKRDYKSIFDVNSLDIYLSSGVYHFENTIQNQNRPRSSNLKKRSTGPIDQKYQSEERQFSPEETFSRRFVKIIHRSPSQIIEEETTHGQSANEQLPTGQSAINLGRQYSQIESQIPSEPRFCSPTSQIEINESSHDQQFPLMTKSPTDILPMQIFSMDRILGNALSSKTLSKCSIQTDKRKRPKAVITIPKYFIKDSSASHTGTTLKGSPAGSSPNGGNISPWNKFKQCLQKPFKISDLHIEVKAADQQEIKAMNIIQMANNIQKIVIQHEKLKDKPAVPQVEQQTKPEVRSPQVEQGQGRSVRQVEQGPVIRSEEKKQFSLKKTQNYKKLTSYNKQISQPERIQISAPKKLQERKLTKTFKLQEGQWSKLLKKQYLNKNFYQQKKLSTTDSKKSKSRNSEQKDTSNSYLKQKFFPKTKNTKLQKQRPLSRKQRPLSTKNQQLRIPKLSQNLSSPLSLSLQEQLIPIVTSYNSRNGLYES